MMSSMMNKFVHVALLAWAWACSCVDTVSASKKYDGCRKDGPDYSCCAPDPKGSLSLKFILEFDGALPLPLCFTFKRQLELDFVISYNNLARLNCDKPCFRRATDARILTPQQFVDCRFPPPPTYYPPAQTNAMIIELDLEQAGECETALDASSTTVEAIKPGVFVNACGHPAWAWDYAFHPTKYGPHQCFPDDNVVCCCVCGSDRPLSEEDLRDHYSQAISLDQFLSNLELVKVTELFAIEDCPEDSELYSAFVLLEFNDDIPALPPSEYSSFYGSYSDLYNEFTFSNCDELGRFAGQGSFAPLADFSARRDRSLQTGSSLRANQYPSYACTNRTSCGEAESFVGVRCSALLCPSEDIFDMYTRGNRRLEMQGPYQPLTTGATVNDIIVNECLCPTHPNSSLGRSPTAEEYLSIFNDELASNPIGGLVNLVEYGSFRAAGQPRDYIVWLRILVKGNPCRFDSAALQELAETVRIGYDDIVVEDCDRPLFRQMLTTWIAMDSHLDCHMDTFVAHIHVQLRCHGDCDPYDLIFGEYKTQYGNRNLLAEARLHLQDDEEDKEDFGIQEVPFTTEEHETLVRDLTSQIENDRVLQQGMMNDVFGICVKPPTGPITSTPPSRSSLKLKVESQLSESLSALASEVFFPKDPQCRCEKKYEGIYKKSYKKSKKYWKTINGIYVIPYHHYPCYEYRRLGDSTRELATVPVFDCPRY